MSILLVRKESSLFNLPQGRMLSHPKKPSEIHTCKNNCSRRSIQESHDRDQKEHRIPRNRKNAHDKTEILHRHKATNGMKRCDNSKHQTCENQKLIGRCDGTNNTCWQGSHCNIGIQAIIIRRNCQNRGDHRKEVKLDQKRDSRHIESKKEENKETCDNQFFVRRTIIKRSLTNSTFPIGIILNVFIQTVAMNIHRTSTTPTRG